MTAIPAAGYEFIDAVSGDGCTLVLEGKVDPHRPGWTVGVQHPGCAELADVYPEMDCFWCSVCGWNGRVTGSWVLALWDSR